MKITTRVVIRIEDWKILEEDSYEYTGPVAECKGRSSGGGGQSGKIAYPEYIVGFHNKWLGELDALTEQLPGANPYSQAEAYNPEEDVLTMQTAVDTFNNQISNISPTGDFSNFYFISKSVVDSIVDDTSSIEALVDIYRNEQIDDVNQSLKAFRNAFFGANNVMSSTYVLGESLIQSYALRDVDKFRAELYAQRDQQRVGMVQAGVSQILQLMQLQLSGFQAWTSIQVDAARMKIVANKEYYEGDLELDVKDVLWNVDILQEASSVLGAPGGALPATRNLTKNQSALGGALSGAAAGGMMGGMMAGAIQGGMTGPQGAILGAVVGGVAGLLGG